MSTLTHVQQDALDAVQRGVDKFSQIGILLDDLRARVFPKGTIDAEFDVSNAACCVLARSFDSYWRGELKLEIGYHECVECGFDIDDDRCSYDFDTLTRAWEHVLMGAPMHDVEG